jgi:hypothetical protein
MSTIPYSALIYSLSHYTPQPRGGPALEFGLNNSLINTRSLFLSILYNLRTRRTVLR